MRIIAFLLLVMTMSSCSPKLYTKHATQLLPVYEDRYSEFLDSENTLVAADAYQTVEKTSDGKYIKKIYNPDKMIKSHEITCRDKKATIKNGKYTEWFDNGNLWKRGNYENNKQAGFWEYFAFDGYRYESGNFKNDMRDGIWIAQDSIGRKTTATTYVRGKRDGEMRLYNDKEEVTTIQHFKNGEFIRKEVLMEEELEGMMEYHSNIQPTLLSCSDLKTPREKEKCRNTTIVKILSENLQYPEDARTENIEGKVIIRFRINTEGKMEDITVFRGVSASIEKESLRVVDLMEDWAPTYLKGKPAMSQS